MMKHYAVIVAGGAGNRMQTETPKQFLLLNNLPVLMHTINAFAQSRFHPEILLVLSDQQQSYWKSLCLKFDFKVPHRIISGGTERFYSVKNAIDSIADEGIVAVHDAVRPLISPKLIDQSFSKAEVLGNVILAVQSSDSVRLLKDDTSTALKRDEIYLVQTPQTFILGILRTAYQQPYRKDFTDDASVVETLGTPINIMEGERKNIKVTYPIDLKLAELLIKEK